MKPRKAHVESKIYALPALRFEEQKLTSCAGTVVLQVAFDRLKLKKRLAKCFKATPGAVYATHMLILLLIVHLMIGCWRWDSTD